MVSGPDLTLLSCEQDKSKRTIVLAVIGILLLGGAVLVGLVVTSARRNAADARAVTEAAASDLSQVSFSDLHLSAEENFLNQQVVYLDGKIANAGRKIVRQVNVRLSFHDPYGQIVLRDNQEVLGSQPLPPGQERAFQIRFDRLPDSWNQSVPEVQILSMRVQQP
jgi:hypothetical protein